MSAQEQQEQELADLKLQCMLRETVPQTQEQQQFRTTPVQTQEQEEEDKSDEEMLEHVFGFLPKSTEGQTEKGQDASQVTPPRRIGPGTRKRLQGE